MDNRVDDEMSRRGQGLSTYSASPCTSLQEARRLLASALIDMAETALLRDAPLPQPDPSCADPEADLEEPPHLLLTAV